MKIKMYYWPLLASAMLFQGCGGASGNNLLGDDKTVDRMTPEQPAIDYATIARPSENAKVMTTDQHYIYDVAGNKVQLRGVDLNYYVAPDEMLTAMDAIAATGANVVRLLIDKNTTASQLQAALDKAVENNLVVIVSLTDDAGQIKCADTTDFIGYALVDLWFGEWHEVLIQDKYQAHLMINFANGWGPKKIFSASSLGYGVYVDVYKSIIGVFRNAGFKMPLVIDAPGCGQDFNAFLAGRGAQLKAYDIEHNVVLSAAGEGSHWNSSDRISNANSMLVIEKVPFFMAGFAGSEVGFDETEYVDHLDVMAKAQGDKGIRIDMQWASDADGGIYAMPLPATTDLTGGAASVDIFLDRPLLQYARIDGTNNYAPGGTLTVSAFVRDVNGNELIFATTEAKDIRQYVWNLVRGDLPAADAIDPTNIITGTEFDISQITHVGVQVLANGKPVNINGDIQIDNLRLFPGVPPILEQEFTDSIEGWSATWGTNPTLAHADGAMTILPGGDNFAIAMLQSTVQSIDFTKSLKVSFDLYVPEGYTGPTWGNMFANFGSDWSIQPSIPVPVGGATPGKWTTITIPVDWSVDHDVSLPQNLLFQIGGFTGTETVPLQFDNFIVEDVDARPTKTITATQFRETFREDSGAWADVPGWGDGGKATVGVVDEVLYASVPGSADADFNGAINNGAISGVQEIDFGGPIVVKLDILIPSSLDGTDAYFDVFIQDGNWGHFVVGTITPADVTLDVLTSVEFRVEEADYPSTFARSLPPNRFGVAYTNVKTAAVFQLDNIEIIGDKEVDDLQPIFIADFNDESQVAAFAPVSASGSQDLGSLEVAKSADWHIVPFGWTAMSWFGAENDQLGLDLSNTVNEVDLSPRGEEVVNGENGIAETADPVSF